MTRPVQPEGFASRYWREVRPGGLLPAAGLVMLMSLPAGAQLSLDQLSMVVPLAPGAPRVGVLTVRNDGTQAVQATVTLEDWDRDAFGVNRFHPLGTVAGSCGARMQVFPPTLALDPGAQQAIRITIDSSAVITRECWALAVVEKVEPPAPPGTGVRYRVRAAAKVYAQPAGLPLRASVEALRVGAMQVGKDSIAGIEVAVHNAGSRHFEATLMVQVRRTDNTVVRTVRLP